MAKAKAKKKTYGLAEERASGQMAVPKLAYQPRNPRRYHPPIGLIGCGGITGTHLGAYRKAGFNVVALCDLDESRAEARRKEFFPDARVYTDYRQVLGRADIEVVDVATHPHERAPIIKDALLASKHVLSQKPFVLDLELGRKLADLADKKGLRLAVNQNGRWAPHVSYMRQAIDKGLIGDVFGAHLSVHWNHEWITNTPFNNVHHVVLYDFAIHWFDMINCYMGGRKAKRVFASLARAGHQKAKPPLLGQVLIEYDDAQASLAFDAAAHFGPEDRTYLAGTRGALRSVGPNLSEQTVTMWTAGGWATPALRGTWFPDGFHGTMGELLCAIEEKRQPSNNARDNLQSLALCFAAVKSAETGKPQIPGKVRRIKT